MSAPAHHELARLLIGQSRYDLAETKLRRALADDPQDAKTHSLLALCRGARGDAAEAQTTAQRAVALAPDFPFAHYVLGSVFANQGRLKEAREAAGEALRLDPDDPDHHALVAQILIHAQRWDEALEHADDCLRLDAAHADCANLPAIALVKLGRQQEAHATIDQTLADNPENPTTHTNQGWALLHRSRPKAALVHFREALHQDPGHEWAKQGLVEALKARNPIYRWLLAYFLWMSTLSPRARFAFIFGGYIVYRVLRSVATTNPEAAPFVWPFLGVYTVFVLLTWIGDPLFNLMLRVNPYGRYALSRTQRTASNWFGGLLLAALIALVAGAATGVTSFYFLSGLLAIMVLPVSGTLGNPDTKDFKLRCAVCILIVAAGGVGIAGHTLDDELVSMVGLLLFGLGFFGFILFLSLSSVARPSA